jgi:hypothetical protein
LIKYPYYCRHSAPRSKFPTLLLFTNQTPREYTGPPTEAAILRGVRRLRAPAVARLEGDAEIDTFLERAAEDGSGVFLSVGADEAPFEEVAEELKERMYFAEARPSKVRSCLFSSFVAFPSRSFPSRTRDAVLVVKGLLCVTGMFLECSFSIGVPTSTRLESVLMVLHRVEYFLLWALSISLAAFSCRLLPTSAMWRRLYRRSCHKIALPVRFVTAPDK